MEPGLRRVMDLLFFFLVQRGDGPSPSPLSSTSIHCLIVKRGMLWFDLKHMFSSDAAIFPMDWLLYKHREELPPNRLHLAWPEDMHAFDKSYARFLTDQLLDQTIYHNVSSLLLCHDPVAFPPHLLDQTSYKLINRVTNVMWYGLIPTSSISLNNIIAFSPKLQIIQNHNAEGPQLYEMAQQIKKAKNSFGYQISVEFCNSFWTIMSEERRESMAQNDFDENKRVCSQKHQTCHPHL